MIPLVNLKLQYKLHRSALEKTLLKTGASAEYILGPEVTRFEKRFANFIKVKHAVGVASGTDALRLSCLALGIGLGDEVLVPANTFIATALAVHSTGATPVPIDIHSDTFLLDIKEAEKRISPRTKAIIPVHIYGQVMDMDALMLFAKKHNLLVIEDACQAHGAKWKQKYAGSLGKAGCFSFYPSKNLGALGDAGLITTNDSNLAKKLRKMRNYGSDKKYTHDITGCNSRLDSIQAGVLNVKMKFLNNWNKKRFQIACQYSEGLHGIKGITPPQFDKNDPAKHVFHLFVIQSDRRNKLSAHLNNRGIQCGIHYPTPFHLQKNFSFLNGKKGDFPISEKLAARILSLPMFPELTQRQIDTIVKAIREF